ncbi:MAG: hypothetical protein P8166_08900 [Candidatus Thiodiazotropha sp.]
MENLSERSHQVVYHTPAVAEDVIDISELFNKIAVRWRFILGLVLIVSVFTFGVLGVFLLIDTPEKRYAEILQFNFPEAAQGSYPSGQKFSHNDIISTKVLEEVYRNNGLQQHGLAFEQFVNAISANPFSWNERFIQAKYTSLLASNKLTRPEIESLEAKFTDELNASQSRFVRLSFLQSELQGIDPMLVEKILADIPKVWSRIAIQELGVLDLKVAGASFYQPQLIDRFEYLQALAYLKESGDALSDALEALIDDEIGGSVRGKVSGQSAQDLQIQLKNLLLFEIEPLFASVTNLAITRDKVVAMNYLENTIRDLQDEKDVLMQKADNFSRVIEQYTSHPSQGGVSGNSGERGGLAQYDGTFLDKFTALIEDKNDKVFQQKLLNEQLTLMQKVEDLQGKITKFKRARQRLEDSETTLSQGVRQGVISDIAQARAGFERVLSTYEELLSVRNEQVLGNLGNLYKITNNALIVESGFGARLKRMVLITVLAGVLALMAAMTISLFRPAPSRAEAN